MTTRERRLEGRRIRRTRRALAAGQPVDGELRYYLDEAQAALDTITGIDWNRAVNIIGPADYVADILPETHSDEPRHILTDDC